MSRCGHSLQHAIYSIGVNNDQAALRAKASYEVRSSDLLVELGLETLHYREKNL